MASQTMKLEGVRFIVTMDPERRIIRDGTVVIDGQRITEVGKATDLQHVTADRTIDAREMVLTPGFCNGHMHISYAHATRGIFPDDIGNQYLPNVFRLQAVMTPEEEYHTSLLGITELLKYGTTCFLDPGSTKHLHATMEAYEQSGCRIMVGAHVTDQPNPINLPVYTTDQAISLMAQTIEAYNNRLEGRVQAWAMPFSSDFCSSELLQAAKEISDQHDTGLTLHQGGSASSVNNHLQKHGKRPIEYLEEQGVLGPRTLLAHVIGIDDAEIDSMARTDTKTVMCPTAALKGASGTTLQGKLPEMLGRGVCVALGTDAGNNANLIETMRSMYLAAIIYKDARQDPTAVPAETALEMATINGARAFGLDGDIGSIEVGKKADLVLFDTRRAEWRTLFNPVNNLVYNADGRSVHTVIVDGRVVVEDHKPTFVDEWELIQKVQAIGENMLSRTGVSFPGRWPMV